MHPNVLIVVFIAYSIGQMQDWIPAVEHTTVSSKRQKMIKITATIYGAALCLGYLLFDKETTQLAIASSIFLAIFSPGLHIFRDSKLEYTLLEKIAHAKIDNIISLILLWATYNLYGNNVGIEWFFASLVPFVIIINLTKSLFWKLSEGDQKDKEKNDKYIEPNVPWLSMLMGATALGFFLANNDIEISLALLLDGQESAIDWLPVMIGSIIHCTILKTLVEYSMPIYEHFKK